MATATLRARFEKAGQSHVFQWLDAGKLSRDEAAALIESLEALDLDLVASDFAAAMRADASALSAGPLDDIAPLDEAFGDTTVDASEATLGAWREQGMAAIARGEVAAMVMAGGQGTRLGYEGPKGCFDMGLPSGKSLFALFAERILRLIALSGGVAKIPLVVMTSKLNDAETRAFFESHAHFGLDPTEVIFFSQGTLPAFSPDGKLFLAPPGLLAEAPDGNGGIYKAAQKTGTLDSLAARGVNFVHVFSVDNALCRVCDPVFVGYCAGKRVPVGSKVMWKSSPAERVGVLCERRGRPAVVEYSELPTALAERRGADDKLVFGAGNICNHLLSLEFLRAAADAPCDVLPLHVARKSITPAAALDAAREAEVCEKNAVKLEAFIFDAFAIADSMAALDVRREEEFAPVKNGQGNDSPATARAALLALGARWVASAGGVVEGAHGVEVSSLLSYAGEGDDFASRVRGRTLDATQAPALLQ